MSKILRRPMFRGGSVDSRGTGITSGLGYEAGGRVGLSNGGDLKLGGDLYTQDDYTKFITNYADSIKSPALYKSIFTTNDDGEIVVKEGSDFSYENLFGKAKGDTVDEKGKFVGESVYTNLDSKIGDAQSKGSFLPPPPGTDALARAIKSDVTADLKASKQFESTEPRGGGADAAQYGIEPEDPEQNEPSNTEISAKDLIKENAELFKELLGEGQKEKVKKARIGDASDYLLKFFEGTQQEGATVGSAAADVAGFATAKDSRTEKAIAANEKVDQTATVLAINDYISGKRSKEDIQKALSIAAATAKMKEGSIGDQILAVAARQTLTGGKIKEILGAAVGDNEAKGIRTIPAGQEGAYKPGPEDEGFFIFEEGTKNVFKFEDGVLKNVYRPN